MHLMLTLKENVKRVMKKGIKKEKMKATTKGMIVDMKKATKQEGGSKMSDLISRKALIEAIKDRQKCFWDSEEIDDEYCNVIILVNEQPTVEAKPVVHGEWIKTRLAMEYQCSNCQNVVYAEYTRSGYKLFNFCPECGSDMRKKVQE